MRSTSKSRFLVLAALASALAVSACNTMEGVGQDTQAAGKALENKAQDAKSP
jgi:entericidin B